MAARGRIGAKDHTIYAESGLVSLRDAARILAVSARSVRRYIDAGVLTHVRLGDRVLVPRKALIDLIAANTHRGRIA